MTLRPATGRQFGKAPLFNAVSQRSAEVHSEMVIRRACAALALVGVIFLTIRRWLLIGPYPPGLDGAQWIALGRGFHGAGRSTEGAYAPFVPLLATVANTLIGPLPTLRLLAIVSGLTVALAVWLLARDLLGPVWSLAAMSLAIPASALAEPVLYGGYPQLFALAGGIVFLWSAIRYFNRRDVRYLWIVSLSSLLAASAHHIYFPLMLLSLLTAVVFRTSVAGTWRDWRGEMPFALALFPACTLFAIVAIQFVSLGYRAPLEASARSVWDAWRYATREATFIWLGLIVIAVVILVSSWQSRGKPAWLASASLIVPAGLLFLVSGQPRLLPPVLIGTALAFGLGLGHVAPYDRRCRLPVQLGAVVVAASLMVSADRAAVEFAEFYRVVDRSLVDAATSIARDDGTGSVAVRQDRRGWPVGWWFEALTTRPVVVGSDPRWLGFPDERENARQAAALFDGSLTPAQFIARTLEGGVGYLVISKWDWIGWERWLSDPAFPVSVLFDNDRYLVLRVNR